RHPLDAPAFPSVAAAMRADLETLGRDADLLSSAPWQQLTGGEVAIVPLVGRTRVVGFIAGVGGLPLDPDAPAIERWTLALLAGEAGVVLENHALETLRGERG